MFNNILVPLDGSYLAERSFDTAISLARKSKAEVQLLRVPVYTHFLIAEHGSVGLLYPNQSLEKPRII